MDISDLLVRHEKLVHLNENNKDNGRPRKLSSGPAHHTSLSDSHIDASGSMGLHRPLAQQPQAPQHQPPPQHQHQLSQHQQQPPRQPQPTQYHPNHVSPPGSSSLSQDPRSASRTAACNLDLLSDAALASEVNSIPPIGGDSSQRHSVPAARVKGYGDSVGQYSDRPREDQHSLAPAYAPPAHQGFQDDYNLFLDDFAPTPHFLPPHFEPDQQMSLWSRSPANRGPSKPSSQYPSRFGSLAPDHREPHEPGTRNDDASRAQSLRISITDHNTIKNRLDEFSSVLPNDFVFPSRHTLTRFLEGYITGFHEHLPFLHLPTLSPVDIAPELLLAVLAVGAQYRFESNRGYALWFAAKAVAMEQIRRRHSSEMNALLPTPAAYSPHSTRPSPSTTYRHSFASAQSERPITQDTHREP
ncbi:hypothetical protein ACO1O0_001880 [Amphichorda felina]